MDARKLEKLRQELTTFLDQIVGGMGHSRRRRWCEVYLRGLLLDGHRKSIEPLAMRLKAVEQGAEDYEPALQQFINQSPWNEQDLVAKLQGWICQRFAPSGFLILDDTGFPKQGESSVGVARRYTGTLGKVGSCQVAVTLQFATERDVVALDARLYLPKVWTDNAQRCRAAGIPETVGYQPKWELALAMIRRARANGLSGIVLADSLFGSVTKFREQLRAEGCLYCVGVDSTLKVIAADADLGSIPAYSGVGRPPSRPRKVRRGARSPSVGEWGQEHSKTFRRVTWREGTKGRMTSRFAAWRIRPAHRLASGKEPLPACWL